MYVLVIEDGVKTAYEQIKLFHQNSRKGTQGMGIICTDDSIQKSKSRWVSFNERGEPTASCIDEPVEVQDFWKDTHRLRGIDGIYLNSIKKNRKMLACDWLNFTIKCFWW